MPMIPHSNFFIIPPPCGEPKLRLRFREVKGCRVFGGRELQRHEHAVQRGRDVAEDQDIAEDEDPPKRNVGRGEERVRGGCREVPCALGTLAAAGTPKPDGEDHGQTVRFEKTDSRSGFASENGDLRAGSEPDAAHVEHEERDGPEKAEKRCVRFEDHLPHSGIHGLVPNVRLILFSSTAWQATWSMTCGRSRRQRSLAYGQRGWKAHPGGGASGLGTSPATGVRGLPLIARSGTASSSIRVYGWLGREKSCADGASSTTLPRYITPTRSAMWDTTARLCEMKM